MSIGHGASLPAIFPTRRITCWLLGPTNASTRSHRKRCPARGTAAICRSLASMSRVRTALVTGGSGGIGKACARKLCELSYDVVLSARRVDPLRAAAEDIGARYLVADASDPVGFVQAIDPLETVDLLVHAAGTLGGTYARKQTFEQWQ